MYSIDMSIDKIAKHLKKTENAISVALTNAKKKATLVGLRIVVNKQNKATAGESGFAALKRLAEGAGLVSRA